MISRAVSEHEGDLTAEAGTAARDHVESELDLGHEDNIISWHFAELR